MVTLDLDFLPHLKKLEDLTKKPWMTSAMAGSYSSIFKGSGIEFESFSVYTPDQDSKNIDWKASAKSEKTLMRNYVEERDIDCFILMDSSSSMFFSSTNKMKCEYAAELVNSLAFAIIASGDKSGIFMSSKEKQINIPPKSGKKNYFMILNELTNGENYGGARNILFPLELLFKSKDKGILFIVSDFLNATDEELEMISLLKDKFVIFVLMIRDRRERFLPKDLNAVVIEDIEQKKSIVVNLQSVRQEYEETMRKNEIKLEQFFLRHDVNFEKFYTHEQFENKLFGFFERVRKKKWI